MVRYTTCAGRPSPISTQGTRAPESFGVEWHQAARPGPFGAVRDQRYAEYDQQFGRGNWRITWRVEDRSLDFEEMASYYEDAYFAFLAAAPGLVRRLCNEVADVYEDSLSNIESGTDYSKQESARNHIVDIVIRRCIPRLGQQLRGARLLQFARSSPDPLCISLSPGAIPFHRPELILKPELVGWWDRASVEAFYQSNKILEVRATSL